MVRYEERQTSVQETPGRNYQHIPVDDQKVEELKRRLEAWREKLLSSLGLDFPQITDREGKPLGRNLKAYELENIKKFLHPYVLIHDGYILISACIFLKNECMAKPYSLLHQNNQKI